MIIQADARQIPLRDRCVKCVVTSPPYWGLRDYGTARWDGGSPDCDHAPDKRGGRFATPVSSKQASNAGSGTASRSDCPCGAKRIDAQIGLEPTPDDYVAALVAVFRDVRRVLADDGVLWLNLGDSYSSGGREGAPNAPSNGVGQRSNRQGNNIRTPVVLGLKPKDLVGIPWRVAFALQSDGWYLRSDIIWAKPNPMPESVTDRPTKAHEYVFLLAKSERYYYDADAIREPSTLGSGGWQSRWMNGQDMRSQTSKSRDSLEHGQGLDGVVKFSSDRNARSVWTISTKPYTGAHFATMPEQLAGRCIKAGSKPGDLVLDPFGGSGTTAQVAYELNRRGVMLDLNMAYLDLAVDRTSELQPSLLELADGR